MASKFVDSAGLKIALQKVKSEIDTTKASILAQKATATTLGVVMPGTNMTVGTDGKLNVATGSTTALGVLKVGSNLACTSGTVSVATGSTTALGVLKVGSNLTCTSGTVAVDTTKVALKTDINTAITNLIGGAPETLDTLQEIADALGQDANLSATLTASIATKANSADVYTKTVTDSTFVKQADLAALSTTEINTVLSSVWA